MDSCTVSPCPWYGYAVNMFDVVGVLILLAQALIVLVVAISLLLLRSLTRPPRRTAAHALAAGLPIDPSGMGLTHADAELKDHRDRPLDAWRVAGHLPDGPVAIVIHGWADSRYQSQAWLGPLAPLCRSVFLFDLPGHGESPHTRCSWGPREIELICAIVEQVRRIEPQRRVLLLGYSMGGAIAIAAGARCGVDAVVADSVFRDPFTTIRRSLRRRRLPGWPMTALVFALMKWFWPSLRGFDTAEHASRLACPLLVMHAGLDHLVTAEESKAIADAAPQGQWSDWSDATHNEAVRRDANAYQQRLESFIAKL